MDNYKQMLVDAIETDGLQFCLDALQEECAELIQAVSHMRRNRTSSDKLIEEMADVQIMLDMVRVGIDREIGFLDRITKKSHVIGDSIRFKMETKNGKISTDKSAKTESCSPLGDHRHIEITNSERSRVPNTDIGGTIDGKVEPSVGEGKRNLRNPVP